MSWYPKSAEKISHITTANIDTQFVSQSPNYQKLYIPIENFLCYDDADIRICKNKEKDTAILLTADSD